MADQLNVLPLLKLTPHESVEIRSHSAEALEVEVVYAPGGEPPPKHLHPAQDERFEVHAGEINTVVDGRTRTLHRGDTLDVPHRVAHQLWNAGEEEARATWITHPSGRTRQW